MKAFKLNDSDVNKQCLPLFVDVISNNVFDAEKFFPKFYKIVTQLDAFCGLTKDSSTVVGFELANHVLAKYKKSLSSVSTTSISEDCDLSEREVAVVVYIAGYVFGQLYRRIRKSKLWESDLCQQKLALFKAGKIESVDSDDRYRLVKCRDRGGLWYVDDVINIFIKTEKNFKLETRNFTQKIDFEKIVKTVINVDHVQTSIKNIEAMCDVSVDSEALQNFLNLIVLQYVRVRAHSFANDQVQKHKQKFKLSKTKGLRTELKRCVMYLCICVMKIG